jgi:hypothetical protein
MLQPMQLILVLVAQGQQQVLLELTVRVHLLTQLLEAWVLLVADMVHGQTSVLLTMLAIQVLAAAAVPVAQHHHSISDLLHLCQPFSVLLVEMVQPQLTKQQVVVEEQPQLVLQQLRPQLVLVVQAMTLVRSSQAVFSRLVVVVVVRLQVVLPERVDRRLVARERSQAQATQLQRIQVRVAVAQEVLPVPAVVQADQELFM